MPISRKPRVLILCTGNSCRSQMAEALWRHEAGDRYNVESAGTVPKEVHPLTKKVLEEAGIPADGLRSRHVANVNGPFDVVITVCDDARDTCPVLPGAHRREHWPFRDPATAVGSEDEVLDVFRGVRDAIRARIQAFLASEAL